MNMSRQKREPPRKRHFRFTLKSGDILFYMHIPKTAGTSLFSFISEQFKPEEVFPFRGSEFENNLNNLTPEEIGRYRFIHAHFDYTIYKLLSRKPVYITMLRDPVERVFSAYQHTKMDASHRLHSEITEKNLSLKEMIDHPLAPVSNVQVGYLVGKKLRTEEFNQLSDQAKLEIAKVHLDEFAFFGITEYFNDSVELLCGTFGWEPQKDHKPLNRSLQPSQRENITPEEIRAIEERNQLDMHIYEYARKLFRKRFRNMGAE